MKNRTLNEINRADLRLWSVFASMKISTRFKILYSTLSPTNFLLNSVFSDEALHSPTEEEVVELNSLYRSLGAEGFVRDFSHQYMSWEKATLTYFWIDPGLHSATGQTIGLTEYTTEQLIDFGIQVRDCFNYEEDFPETFVKRMKKAAASLPSRFFKFTNQEETVGVVSLFDTGEGWWSLMNFGIHPNFRGKGFSRIALSTLLSSRKEKIYLATENEILLKSTLPSLGFRLAGTLRLVPLRSVCGT